MNNLADVFNGYDLYFTLIFVHIERLMVLTVVQNLVGSECSSSDSIRNFKYFASMVWKKTYSRSFRGFWGCDPLMVNSINETLKDISLRGYTSRDVYIVKIGPACDMCTWQKQQKRKTERNLTVANWVFVQTTHVVGSKWNFAWSMALEG